MHLRRARSGPLPASENPMSNEVFRSGGQNSQNRSTRIVRWLTLAAALVALSLFSSTQIEAQDQGGQDQPVPQSAQSQQPRAQQPDVQPAPLPRQDSADSRPVTSRDTIPQDQEPGAAPATRHSHDRPWVAANAPANAPVPANL